MDLTKYRNKLIGSEDERAVSPVIGVILMVAITVILAAVIAAFVLDMGDMGETAPSASFDWEQDGDESDGEISVTHQSGDTIDGSDITVQIDGTPVTTGVSGDDWHADNDDISAGSTMTIDNSEWSTGEDVEVIWTSDDGNSQILTSYEAN